MGVKIETEEGKYVEVSNSLARSVLEQVLGMAEDFNIKDDEDIINEAGDIIDTLMRGMR